MDKKSYKYHIQLNMVHDKENRESQYAPLDFDFESHDDIFHIISIMEKSNHFEDRQQAMEFAVGLKLFSGVMLRNKDSELFKDFRPAFVEFMKKLKGR